MKQAVWLPTLCSLFLILTGCTNTDSSLANDPLGTGPFDAHGNYREDWADDPSKWRRPGSRQQVPPDDNLPAIAKNEEPPPNSTPLAPSNTSRPKVTTSRPKPTVAQAKPKPKPKPKPTVTRYVVRKGDTLSGIASRHGSSVAAIRRANGISGSLIHPGQKLVVPKR